MNNDTISLDNGTVNFNPSFWLSLKKSVDAQDTKLDPRSPICLLLT